MQGVRDPSSRRAAAPSPPIIACWCSTSWAYRAWANPAAHRPGRNQSLADHQEPAGELSRRAAGTQPGTEPVQLGYLSLDRRCQCENLYWAIGRRIQALAQSLDYFPEELGGLEAMLSDTYICGFSLSQSMPDSEPSFVDMPKRFVEQRNDMWLDSAARNAPSP
jgi:hypothetical protein